MADIEMKAAENKAKDEGKKEEKKQEEAPKPPPSPVAEIKSNIALIERAVSTLEPRFTHRVLRTLTALRKRIDATVLRNAIEEVYTKGSHPHSMCCILSPAHKHQDVPEKKTLLSWLPEGSVAEQSMEVDSSGAPAKPSATPAPSVLVPEGEIYLRLLILHYLQTSPATYRKALALAIETVEKMQALNRRSMDPIAAKVWFAVERTYELAGELADARP